MEWFSTITFALGSAWTSGINLYATVAVLGMLQRFGATKLPGGLEVLDNWWIIGIAAFLYSVEFFADKIPYLDSVWDAVHTFIRVPAAAALAYGATTQMDSSVEVVATLLGGGLAFASHSTKATARLGANLSPEPFSNWALSLVEDVIAFLGTFLAVFAPVLIAIVLILFVIMFLWFFPKIFRAFRRMWRSAAAFLRGDSLKNEPRNAA